MARSSAARCSLISSQSLISCPLPARAPPRAAAAQSACQPHSRPIPPSSLSSKFLLVIALPGAQPLAPYLNTSRFISPAPSRRLTSPAWRAEKMYIFSALHAGDVRRREGAGEMKRLVFMQGARGCAPGNAITRRNLDESDEGGIGLLCGWHADWAAAARGGARAGRGHEMSDGEEISDQRAAELRAISRHCQRSPQMHPYARDGDTDGDAQMAQDPLSISSRSAFTSRTD